MPFVQVRFRFEKFGGYIDPIIAALPAIVAKALDCADPGGDLTPADIEVEVIEVGDKDVFNYDLSVSVEAKDFPSRLRSIDIRQCEISKEVKRLLPYEGIKGFVWLRLVPASFGEFICEETPKENQVISDCCRMGEHKSCDPNHPVCMGFGHFPKCICDCHKQPGPTVCGSCAKGRHTICERRMGDAQCACPRCYPAPPEEPVVCDYCNVGRHDECERLKGDPCHCPRCWAEPVVCEYCMTGRHDDCERLRDVGECNCAECYPPPAAIAICPSCQNDRHDHCDNIHDTQNPCKCPCHDPNISEKDREQWRIEMCPE